MASRAPSVKRISRPLAPIASAITVVNDAIVEIQPIDVTPEAVGLKAYGLSSLPAVWTRPFFVIPAGTTPTLAALELALERLGLARDKRLIVRSSGIEESMGSRGALDSAECDLATLQDEINRLRASLNARMSSGNVRVHWIVQQLLPARAKGHLSNEARVAEDKRDWIAEVEGSAVHAADTRPISLRTWRDNRPPHEETLLCQYRERYTQALSTVARWAYVGQPVIVMWFVDVPGPVSKHAVLPWYHEPWRADTSPHKAAPRRKLSATTDFVLRNRSDWDRLKERVEGGDPIVRVRVQPSDPDIVREREFAENLAVFAKDHQLVIELQGGILSHAYYMLSRAGCIVECADLDDYAIEDFELEFNKLVRDKIPAAIFARGEAVTALRLEGAALITALKRKLIEEAFEVLDAPTNDDIADEIADVREVILALMSRLGISEIDVESRRKRKLRARGSFDNALMLTRTAVASPLGLKEIQTDEGHDRNLVSGSIQQELEIPRPFTDIHVDRRVDAAGIQERQFTIDVPAHAEGYQANRAAFNLPTQAGAQHEMVIELQIDRTGSNLRVRTRLRNAAVQLELDLKSDSSDQRSGAA